MSFYVNSINVLCKAMPHVAQLCFVWTQAGCPAVRAKKKLRISMPVNRCNHLGISRGATEPVGVTVVSMN